MASRVQEDPALSCSRPGFCSSLRLLPVILLKFLATWGPRPFMHPPVHVSLNRVIPTRGMAEALGPQSPPPLRQRRPQLARPGRRRSPPRLLAASRLFSLLSSLLLPGGFPPPYVPAWLGRSATDGVDSRRIPPSRLLCPCSPIWKITSWSDLGMSRKTWRNDS